MVGVFKKTIYEVDFKKKKQYWQNIGYTSWFNVFKNNIEKNLKCKLKNLHKYLIK